MIERDNTVRAIAWSEIFPWLSILRVFRIAVAARVLVLAAAGVLIMATGWGLIGKTFGPIDCSEPYTACPWTAVGSGVPDRPPLFTGEADVRVCSLRAQCPLAGAHDPVSHVWKLLTLPASEGLQNTNQPFSTSVGLLLCGLFAVAVWAFFGAAICRIAAVQLAADEQVGLGAALRFACKKWPAYFAAPLFPIGGVLLAAIPVLILGWIMRADAGLLLGGLIWPLALVAGLLMTLLLVGVLFGWPLMWATISAEGTDSFDALSRSYAYVFQRPLHYLFYAFIAGFIGWLGWLFVQNFAAGVVWMAYWAAGWGCGKEQLDIIINGGADMSTLAFGGKWLVHFFTGCVKLLAVGFLFSYFWTASTAIYFLLRRDVDATDMDEVYLDSDASEDAFDLPKVTTDSSGAPVTEDDPAENAES
jgi:thiamine transporter ThiT